MIDFESSELRDNDDNDQAELFYTSFGEIQYQEAIDTATDLANRSFTHAFVGTIPTTDDKSDPFAYTTTSRYTLTDSMA
jgi:hypothetical protein